MIDGKIGSYQVTQIGPEGALVRRDFDAEEWRYEWTKMRSGGEVLRLTHDGDPCATTDFCFVDFSTPVSIEFVSDVL